MKIKNNKDTAIYVGYKGIRPGFTLQGKQIGPPHELNPSLANNQRIKNDVEAGHIQLVLSDADRRFLGIKGSKSKKEEPVEVPSEPAATPAVEPVEEPEEVTEVVVDEPVVEPEEPAEEPVDGPEELEETDYSGYELPKPKSKMNKGDWCEAAATLGIADQVDMDKTGKELAKIVTDRMEELGL